MYKVYTEDEVIEVKELEDAKEIVDTETPAPGYEDKSGFHGPWVEDEDGNVVYSHPGYFVTQ